ncbi:MAG: hypothetical protein JWM09_748 [Francisellaceae bacterium]|nr:hypothetical protein [Francisellaceae bacterium]
MSLFLFPILISLAALSILFYSQGSSALILALVLSILEISLSFDNAILNASMLKNMSAFWRKCFLTWGIFIAVIIIRFILPILIVCLTADLSPIQVLTLILYKPLLYSEYLMSAHPLINAFGGSFLLLVFLSYLQKKFFHNHNTLFYFIKTEILKTIPVVIAITMVIKNTPFAISLNIINGALTGVGLHFLIEYLVNFINKKNPLLPVNPTNIGLSGFLYLELLDASFSLDGVIAAFALTSNFMVILVGLGIGALFVRSFTIKLSHSNTFLKLRFLEDGAYYAIGNLSCWMLINIVHPIHEYISGLSCMGIIAISVIASLFIKPKRNKQN